MGLRKAGTERDLGPERDPGTIRYTLTGAPYREVNSKVATAPNTQGVR